MEDKTKHIIAYWIYTITTGFFKTAIKELKFAIKPLLIGLIIIIVFSAIAEWSDVLFGRNIKEPFIIIGIIGFFLPLFVKYYMRLKRWVLKWK